MSGKVRNNEQAIEAYIEVVGDEETNGSKLSLYLCFEIGGIFLLICVSQRDAKEVEGLSAAELIKVDPARRCYPTGLRNPISGLSQQRRPILQS